LTEKRSRLSIDEILRRIFNGLTHNNIIRPSGLAKECGLSLSTVERYIGRILYIQGAPKLKVVQTKVEIFYRLEEKVVEKESNV